MRLVPPPLLRPRDAVDVVRLLVGVLEDLELLALGVHLPAAEREAVAAPHHEIDEEEQPWRWWRWRVRWRWRWRRRLRRRRRTGEDEEHRVRRLGVAVPPHRELGGEDEGGADDVEADGERDRDAARRRRDHPLMAGAEQPCGEVEPSHL